MSGRTRRPEPNYLYPKPCTVKYFFLISLCFLTACQPETPEALLARARAEVESARAFRYILYQEWDNRFIGTVDTSSSNEAFYRTGNPYFSHDFLGDATDYTSFLIGERSGLILHEKEQSILRTEEETAEEFKTEERSGGTVGNSPLYQLRLSDWVYAGDTIFTGIPARRYEYVSYDQVNDSTHYRTVEQLYLAAKTARPLGRRMINTADDRINQVITYTYRNYALDTDGPLTYTPPTGYAEMTQTAFDKSQEAETIAVGEPAPDFATATITGDSFRLSDYRAQKVLLDFSFSGCGGCELAMKVFNRPGFTLKDGMAGVYLSPMNDSREIELYYKDKGMPFLALPEAREAVRLYGVISYPTFVIIDEQGMVEWVTSGFSEETMERLAVQN